MTIKLKFKKIVKKKSLRWRILEKKLDLVRWSCLYWYASIVLELYIFFLIYNKVRDFPSYQFGEIFFNLLCKLYPFKLIPKGRNNNGCLQKVLSTNKVTNKAVNHGVLILYLSRFIWYWSRWHVQGTCYSFEWEN